jgi:predicted enzyme related to lactoylglutathione lyase
MEVAAMSGRVVHFEIPTDDLERAQEFYREAFGWQMNPMPEMHYTMVGTTPTGQDGMPSEPGSINGGMLPRHAPVTAPVITIDVDDIHEALAKIEVLGGKVTTGRQPVGNMGFTAYFTDPEGNLIGLWQTAPRG